METALQKGHKRAVILHSLLRPYKFFLWRLWPVWLLSSIAAGPLPQLLGGYRTDLFGLWWTAWHFW
jgi:hypothetical protein